jgi:hypothetical protein
MKRKCDICGLEADEHWMQSYNVGRKTVWLCWDCYKQSQYEANKSDKHRQQKLYKIYNSKKRNK